MTLGGWPALERLTVWHVLGVYFLIFVLYAILVMFIPTIVRSPTIQVILLFMFIAGCLGYFIIYDWPKRKLVYPK